MTSDISSGSALMMDFLGRLGCDSANKTPPNANHQPARIEVVREPGWSPRFRPGQKTRPSTQYNANGLASPGY
jgi:hypothetical protein